VKFLAITLIVHRPDPADGVQKPTHDRFREVLDNALLAEEPGFDLFHVTPEDQGDRNAESHEVFRQIRRQAEVTAATRFRPPLTDAEVWPRPFQQPIRVWHGSATGKEPADLAARRGDPLFSANVTHPIEPTPAFRKQFGLPVVFESVEDFAERSSAPIGSPQQIVDKVHRHHEQSGHTVLPLHADANGPADARHRAFLELFQSEVAPVLRREIPDPPFARGPVLPVTEEPAHV
jgi:alkanesulfonate monooxygenase SsuD/methylene tetrahydromethanopterin reductase-like flavin-dependent oxidoreductase (luciferase family)